MDLASIGTQIALKQLQDNPLKGAKADPVAQAPGEVLQSFGQLLKDNLNQVNQLQTDAQKAVQTYAVGGPIELHQVMIASERAGLAMDLTMEIRNKLVQAYQEISRMGI